MNTSWNLEKLYLGFDDPKFKTDFDFFMEQCNVMNTFQSRFSNHESVK